MERNLRRQYLEAMGIHSWTPRDADHCEVPGEVEPPLRETPPVQDIPGEQKVNTEVEKGHPASKFDESPPWMDEVPLHDDNFVPADLNDDLPLELDSGLGGQKTVQNLDWKGLRQHVAECQRCELHTSRTNTVFGVGDENANLMVIGEAPGVDEDRKGEPFVGRAGQLLNAMLRAIGLKREQIFIANILKCRPPNNRDPRPEEALCCEPFLKRQIALVRPQVILCVGRVAAQNLLKSQETVGRMRGKSYQFDNIPVIVTYHPAYLLRSPEQKAKAWRDLLSVVNKLK